MIVSASSTPLYVPPTSRQDSVSRADDRDAPDKTDDKRIDRTRPEYSFLLALLASASPSVRADALKKLPPDAASLVERLLNGGGDATQPSVVDGGAAVEAGGRQAQLSREEALSQMRAIMTATDSMRYGMVQEGSLNGTSMYGQPTMRGAIDGDSNGVFHSLPTSTDDAIDRLALANAKRTLARIAGKRGVSQEQLLAIGDTAGARAHAQLQATLAQAGTAEGAALADRIAHVAALAAANSTSASDVTTPVRDTNALAPELRTRLDRVIARMRDEYGSDVSVVETARSQERQDYLYAQGRTRDGAVVTWTRDSAHTRGEAVDVLVDGKWNNAEGFARLQRIAREEGLRTLGIKDPGHLELPRSGAPVDASAHVANLIERRATAAANVSAQSGIASVASVASVATVASVARVGDRGSATADANTIAPDTIATTYAANGMTSANGRSTASRDQRDSKDRPADKDDAAQAGIGRRGASQAHVDTSAAERAYATSTVAPTTTTYGTHAASATAASTGISSAERVADVQQLQADAPSGSLSRMTLELDGVNGPERITVDLRGNVVDTQISTDAANADRLRMHTGELQDALGRHGLTADSVNISSNARTEATGMRSVAVERDGMVLTPTMSANSGADAQTSGQSTRDRAMAREWEKNEDARKARDEQRQNAGQRGQRGTYNEGAR